MTLEGGHAESVLSVSWNHDRSQLVSGSCDETINIWDSVTGTVLHTLEGHSHEVNSVAWNHDGKKIAIGSDDKTIKIWDAVTGTLVSSLEEGNSAPVEENSAMRVQRRYGNSEGFLSQFVRTKINA
jgi:WD40 repeat protein